MTPDTTIVFKPSLIAIGPPMKSRPAGVVAWSNRLAAAASAASTEALGKALEVAPAEQNVII